MFCVENTFVARGFTKFDKIGMIKVFLLVIDITLNSSGTFTQLFTLSFDTFKRPTLRGRDKFKRVYVTYTAVSLVGHCWANKCRNSTCDCISCQSFYITSLSHVVITEQGSIPFLPHLINLNDFPLRYINHNNN